MNPIVPALMSRNNAIMMMNNNGGSGSATIPLWIFLIAFVICGIGMSLPFLIPYIKEKINRRNKNDN